MPFTHGDDPSTSTTNLTGWALRGELKTFDPWSGPRDTTKLNIPRAAEMGHFGALTVDKDLRDWGICTPLMTWPPARPDRQIYQYAQLLGGKEIMEKIFRLGQAAGYLKLRLPSCSEVSGIIFRRGDHSYFLTVAHGIPDRAIEALKSKTARIAWVDQAENRESTYSTSSRFAQLLDLDRDLDLAIYQVHEYCLPDDFGRSGVSADQSDFIASGAQNDSIVWSVGWNGALANLDNYHHFFHNMVLSALQEPVYTTALQHKMEKSPWGQLTAPDYQQAFLPDHRTISFGRAIGESTEYPGRFTHTMAGINGRSGAMVCTLENQEPKIIGLFCGGEYQTPYNFCVLFDGVAQMWIETVLPAR